MSDQNKTSEAKTEQVLEKTQEKEAPQAEGQASQESNDPAPENGQAKVAEDEDGGSNDPFWKQQGFASEEAFHNSYSEGRKTITQLSQAKSEQEGLLAERNAELGAYKSHVDNEDSEIDNIDEYAKGQGEKAKQAAKIKADAVTEANVAIDKFQKDNNLLNEEIDEVLSFAATSSAQDIPGKLSEGLNSVRKREDRIADRILDRLGKSHQEVMKEKADMGSGGSTQTPQPKQEQKLPDFKSMSKEDFEKARQKVMSGG